MEIPLRLVSPHTIWEPPSDKDPPPPKKKNRSRMFKNKNKVTKKINKVTKNKVTTQTQVQYKTSDLSF